MTLGRSGLRNLRILGASFVVTGVFLVLWAGFLDVPIHCPANGCSPEQIWQIEWPSYVAFGMGLELIVAGASVLIISFFLDVEAEAGVEKSIPSQGGSF